MHNFAQVLCRRSFYCVELIVKKLTPISHIGWIILCFNWFENDSGLFRLPKMQARKIESLMNSWCTTLRKCCAGLPFIELNSFWRNWLQYPLSDEYIFVLIDFEPFRVRLGFRKCKLEISNVMRILDAQLRASVARAFLLSCWTHRDEIGSNTTPRTKISLS